MKISKSVLTLIIIISFSIISTLSVVGDAKSNNGLDVVGNNVSNSTTPKTKSDIDDSKTKSVLAAKTQEEYGKIAYPIEVSGKFATVVDNRFTLLDENDTNQTFSYDGSLFGEGYIGWLGNTGKELIVPYGKELVAFNISKDGVAETDAAWKAVIDTDADQSSAPIVYNNGYIYTGITKWGEPTTGVYVCIDTSDASPKDADGNHVPVWQFNPGPGFYASYAIVCGDYIVFPCDDGTIYSVDIKKSIENKEAVVAQKINLDNTAISGKILFDGESLFFSTKSGSTYKLAFDKSAGTFGDHISAEVGAINSPVMAFGRLYLPIINGISVVKTEDLSAVYNSTFESEVPAPVNGLYASVGYATGNEKEVYVYANTNEAAGRVFALKDSKDATSGTLEEIYSDTVNPQYSSSEISATADGSLVFVNDAQRLYLIASKNVPVKAAGLSNNILIIIIVSAVVIVLLVVLVVFKKTGKRR